MFLAVFCALRGNFPALQAILDALDARGIETVFNAGNTAGAYPWPNETIALLRERNIPTVQGTDDRATARLLRTSEQLLRKMPPETRHALEWTHAHTASANIEWLGTLPKARKFTIEGIPILLCHAAPTSAREPLTRDTPLEVFERQREAAEAQLILCGGSSPPFARTIEDTLFVCPGSATAPKEARFAIIDTETVPWSAAFHEVPYDYERVQRRLEETGLTPNQP